MAPAGAARRSVARAAVCPEGDARDLRALVLVILPSVVRAGGARRWGFRCEIGLPWPTLQVVQTVSLATGGYMLPPLPVEAALELAPEPELALEDAAELLPMPLHSA